MVRYRLGTDKRVTISLVQRLLVTSSVGKLLVTLDFDFPLR